MRTAPLILMLVLGAVALPGHAEEPCPPSAAPPQEMAAGVDAAADVAIPRWQVNDVSIAYPFPGAGEKDLLLGMHNTRGERTISLLPESLFERLGTETLHLTESPDRDQHFARLRVVFAGVDPNFEGSGRRVIRLVAQSVFEFLDDDGVSQGNDLTDASVHLFYELEEKDFVDYLNRYKALTQEEALPQRLGVHPILAREGLSGPFARGYNDLLLDHLSEDNLIRMTFMATGRSGNNWFWGLFNENDAGEFVHTDIPGITPATRLDSFDIPRRVIDTVPFIEGFPARMLVLTEVESMSEEEFNEGVAQLQRLENPAYVDATNTRCASCHIASRTLDRALRHRGVDMPETRFSFKAPPGQNLDHVDPTGFDEFSMHGASYFRDDLAISRRAVQEAAAHAHELSTHDPTRPAAQK